jgi:energy-converting hydrogenase Eha subunit A
LSAYDPHAWLEFGVAAAGAAAVLAGLVFVAVSINLEKVLEVHGLPGRAGESILMFVGILIATLFLLVPGQSTDALGVELAVSGLLLALVMLVIIWQGLKLPTRQPLSWRITRIVTALASSVPMLAAGISLLAEQGGGLYWLVAAVILAFCAGVGNAWVLLVEVVRDERYRPVTGREFP